MGVPPEDPAADPPAEEPLPDVAAEAPPALLLPAPEEADDSVLPPASLDEVSPPAGAAVVDGTATPVAAPLALAEPLLLLRKSVTYQPEPFS